VRRSRCAKIDPGAEVVDGRGGGSGPGAMAVPAAVGAQQELVQRLARLPQGPGSLQACIAASGMLGGRL
jgi:hypothetical protein